MPIYEFICKKCRHSFERLVNGTQKPPCPECHSRALEKQWSVFAPGGKETSAPRDPGPASCGTCGDPRGPGACSLD